MLLSYDPTKSERNEELRGLAFSLTEDFDWTTALIVEDTRKDYAEPRYQRWACWVSNCTCWYSRQEVRLCT